MQRAEDAYQQAGITDPRAELAMAEVHDCFTPTELVLMEDLGFAERGMAWKEVLAGTFDLDGELPVNPDGGLKSFGHPIGASGLRMLFECWLQLRGEAPEARQIASVAAGKTKGLTHNLGGAPGRLRELRVGRRHRTWLRPGSSTASAASGSSSSTTALSDDDAATPVPACPGWTVHDLVAHLCGVVDDALNDRMDGAPAPAWTARQVDARKDKSVTDILDEWAGLAATFETLPLPFQAVADVACHEQDLRGALHVPGFRDSEAIEFLVPVLLDRLADRVASHGLAPLEIVVRPERRGGRGGQRGRARDVEDHAVRDVPGDVRAAQP